MSAAPWKSAAPSICLDSVASVRKEAIQALAYSPFLTESGSPKIETDSADGASSMCRVAHNESVSNCSSSSAAGAPSVVPVSLHHWSTSARAGARTCSHRTAKRLAIVYQDFKRGVWCACCLIFGTCRTSRNIPLSPGRHVSMFPSRHVSRPLLPWPGFHHVPPVENAAAGEGWQRSPPATRGHSAQRGVVAIEPPASVMRAAPAPLSHPNGQRCLIRKPYPPPFS